MSFIIGILRFTKCNGDRVGLDEATIKFEETSSHDCPEICESALVRSPSRSCTRKLLGNFRWDCKRICILNKFEVRKRIEFPTITEFRIHL